MATAYDRRCMRCLSAPAQVPLSKKVSAGETAEKDVNCHMVDLEGTTKKLKSAGDAGTQGAPCTSNVKVKRGRSRLWFACRLGALFFLVVLPGGDVRSWGNTKKRDEMTATLNGQLMLYVAGDSIDVSSQSTAAPREGEVTMNGGLMLQEVSKNSTPAMAAAREKQQRQETGLQALCAELGVNYDMVKQRVTQRLSEVEELSPTAAANKRELERLGERMASLLFAGESQVEANNTQADVEKQFMRVVLQARRAIGTLIGTSIPLPARYKKFVQDERARAAAAAASSIEAVQRAEDINKENLPPISVKMNEQDIFATASKESASSAGAAKLLTAETLSTRKKPKNTEKGSLRENEVEHLQGLFKETIESLKQNRELQLLLGLPLIRSISDDNLDDTVEQEDQSSNSSENAEQQLDDAHPVADVDATVHEEPLQEEGEEIGESVQVDKELLKELSGDENLFVNHGVQTESLPEEEVEQQLLSEREAEVESEPEEMKTFTTRKTRQPEHQHCQTCGRKTEARRIPTPLRVFTEGQLDAILSRKQQEHHNIHSIPSRPLIFPSCSYNAPLQKRMREKISLLINALQHLNRAEISLTDLADAIETESNTLQRAATLLDENEHLYATAANDQQEGSTEPTTQSGRLGTVVSGRMHNPKAGAYRSGRSGLWSSHRGTEVGVRGRTGVVSRLRLAATTASMDEGDPDIMDDENVESSREAIDTGSALAEYIVKLFSAWRLSRRATLEGSEIATEIMRRADMLREDLVLPLHRDVEQMTYADPANAPKELAMQKIMGCKGFIKAVKRSVSRASDDLYRVSAHAFAIDVSLPLAAQELQQQVIRQLETLLQRQLQDHRALHARAAALQESHHNFYHNALQVQQEAAEPLREDYNVLQHPINAWQTMVQQVGAAGFQMRMQLAKQLNAQKKLDLRANRLESGALLLLEGLQQVLEGEAEGRVRYDNDSVSLISQQGEQLLMHFLQNQRGSDAAAEGNVFAPAAGPAALQLKSLQQQDKEREEAESNVTQDDSGDEIAEDRENESKTVPHLIELYKDKDAARLKAHIQAQLVRHSRMQHHHPRQRKQRRHRRMQRQQMEEAKMNGSRADAGSAIATTERPVASNLLNYEFLGSIPAEELVRLPSILLGEQPTVTLQRLQVVVTRILENLQVYKQQAGEAEQLLLERFNATQESIRTAVAFTHELLLLPKNLTLEQQEQYLRDELPALAQAVQNKQMAKAAAVADLKKAALAVHQQEKHVRAAEAELARISHNRKMIGTPIADAVRSADFSNVAAIEALFPGMQVPVLSNSSSAGAMPWTVSSPAFPPVSSLVWSLTSPALAIAAESEQKQQVEEDLHELLEKEDQQQLHETIASARRVSNIDAIELQLAAELGALQDLQDRFALRKQALEVVEVAAREQRLQLEVHLRILRDLRRLRFSMRNSSSEGLAAPIFPFDSNSRVDKIRATAAIAAEHQHYMTAEGREEEPGNSYSSEAPSVWRRRHRGGERRGRRRGRRGAAARAAAAGTVNQGRDWTNRPKQARRPQRKQQRERDTGELQTVDGEVAETATAALGEKDATVRAEAEPQAQEEAGAEEAAAEKAPQETVDADAETHVLMEESADLEDV